jgi:hypothetical protein
MQMSVWRIATGVFLGNAAFGLLAMFLASIVADNVRFRQAEANLPSIAAEAQSRLAETCARYEEATGKKGDGCP